MKLFIISGLLSLGVLGVGGASFLDKNSASTTLVSPTVSITPTLSVTPTATPSATPTASVIAVITKKITKAPTPTAKPTPTSETGEGVNKLIDKYSIQYGLDPNVVRHLALCESGLRTNATNSKYVGLFQYDSNTWKNIRAEMGLSLDTELRYSAEEAIRTTAFALSKGKSRLWPNCIP